MKNAILISAVIAASLNLGAPAIQTVCDTTYEWHDYEYLRVDVGTGWEFELFQVKDSVRVIKNVFCHDIGPEPIAIEEEDIE